MALWDSFSPEVTLLDSLSPLSPQRGKVSKKLVDSETQVLLTAIELNQLDFVRQIALSPDFLDNHAAAANTGVLVLRAVQFFQYQFAYELLAVGHTLPDDALAQAILKNERELAANLVRGGYFTGDCSLEFWLCLFLRWFELAEEIQALSNSLHAKYASERFASLLWHPDLLKSCVRMALIRGMDDVAGLILRHRPETLTGDLVYVALSHNNLDFLRRLWVGNHQYAASRPSQLQPGKLLRHLNQTLSAQDKAQLNKCLNAPTILQFLLQNRRVNDAKKVLLWPGVPDEPGVIKTLIQNRQETLAVSVVESRTAAVPLTDFRHALARRLYALCLAILQRTGNRQVLHDNSTQAQLVRLLAEGDSCIHAANMLSVISKKHWNSSLTPILCETSDYLLKRTEEILRCPQPLLFLALLGELLAKVAPLNILHKSACKSSLKLVLTFAKELQENLLEEDVLQHYLLQTDTRQRTALTIIATNSFYSLLTTGDIGGLVQKLWEGPRKHLGLLKASSVYRAAFDAQSSEEGLLSSADLQKPYVFQYAQWTDSCSLRFLGQAISTLVLVVLYTLMIHHATVSGNMEDVAKDPMALIYLRASQVWITGLVLEKALHLLFQVLTGRSRLLDRWAFLDLALFLQMLLLMLEVNKQYAGRDNLLFFVESETLNASMHGLMLIMIWVRLLASLLPSLVYGSLLKMIVLIVQRLIPYSCIFTVVYFSSAVFFTVFFQDMTDFRSFSYSFRTLFAASYNNHNMEEFEGRGLRFFGEIALGIFIVLTYVLMRNFLIAILTYTYEELSELVEAEYRSTLVALHEKWKWHKHYGLLILLPSPFSWAVMALVPLILLGRWVKTLNTVLSVLFFLIFSVPQFAMFAICSALCIPFAYVKSIVKFVRQRRMNKAAVVPILQVEDDEEDRGQEKRAWWIRLLLWLLFGPLLIALAYIRDLFRFWQLLYLRPGKTVSVTHSPLTPRFFRSLQKFLKKVNSREVELDTFVAEFREFYFDQRLAQSSVSQTVQDFFTQFIRSKHDRVIDIELMKTLLPKQDTYSPSYIKNAKHIYVRWLVTTIDNFKHLLGGVPFQGLLLPKAYLTGETSQIKRIKYTALKAQVAADNVHQVFDKVSRDLAQVTQQLTRAVNQRRSSKN